MANNFIQNLLEQVGTTLNNFDPFGIKANQIANENLYWQQQLASQQNLARQQDIARRQQQPGGLDYGTYSKLMELSPAAINTFNENQALLDMLNSGGGGGGFGGSMGGFNPADVAKQGIGMADAAYDYFAEADKKFNQYLKENWGNDPWSIDEAQARASADERFAPYYTNQLRDYLTGVIRTRNRSSEDEQTLRGELVKQTERYVGRSGRKLSDAIESTREGFAGAGLYFSGARQRQEGRATQEVQEDTTDFMRGQGLKEQESQLRQQRLGEDLASQEATYRRNQTAERETATLNDIEKQRQEEISRRLFEASQYAGGYMPGAASTTRNLYNI